jgi:DNA repair exonuclease SbcCD nuclease subunit
MTWYNPWAEIRLLKFKLLEAEHTYVKLTKQIKELESIRKENERELDLIEFDLGELREAFAKLHERTVGLEKALAEASKNDTRDGKGRFTKAKK